MRWPASRWQPPRQCLRYFAPSENWQAPVPIATPVIWYSHCTLTPLAPAAFAIPRRPVKPRGLVPSTSAWMRPKAA